MKKLTVLSVVVASLLFVGCGNEKAKEATAPAAEKTAVEKATEATKEVATKAVEKTAEVAKEAGKVADKAVEATKEAASKAVEKTAEVAKEAKDAVAQKATEVKEAVAGVDTKACQGCHGAKFEKKAMNVSKIVKDLTKAEIVTALKGYKDGSYGGAMKGLMKGQVASFDDAKIEAIAAQVGK
ncbi:Cytochrome c, class I [hydrothermal vent metagenome]|uniref:Cytochrome c, class I n=1 Tax=hydrothermal vent metagenome TaxID=652676 RepID=A0A1W1BDT1_9ZZZZ